MCVNCNICTIALHQRHNFDIFEIAIRKSKLLFIRKFDFTIDSKKYELIIAIYLLIKIFIDFSIDYSFDKNILL